MSELVLRLVRASGRLLAAPERHALRVMRREARKHGATLARAGRGNLAPSRVLGVLRRDGYRCKVHGDRGEDDFGGLQVHHKSRLENPSERMRKLRYSEDISVLVTVCRKAHDEIHDRDREETRQA